MKDTTRRTQPGRRFTLVDAMILIAAVAAGCAGLLHRLGGVVSASAIRDDADNLAGFVVVLAAHALLVLRFRRPRPPLWRLVRQPGTVACYVLVAHETIWHLNHILNLAFEGILIDQKTLGGWIWYLFEAPWYTSDYSLLIVWPLLAMGRLWRPERGWIDLAGRAIGWIWIAWVVKQTLNSYLS